PTGAAEATVLAIVDEDTIRACDLDELLIRTHQTMSRDRKESFDYRKLLTKLIHDRLLVREAESIGLDEEPEAQAAIAEERRQQAIRQYVASAYVPPPPVAEEQALAHFREYYWKLQIRQISVASMEEAEEVLSAIRAGASMDSLARQRSRDSWSARGGLHHLGPWIDVEIPVRAAAIDLKAGEISRPFAYGSLFSLVRMESRDEPDTSDYRKVRAKVIGFLQSAAKEKAWRDFVGARKQAIPVQIDPEAIAALEADSDAVLTGTFLRESTRAALTVAGCDTVTEGALRRAVSHGAMTEATAPFDTLLQRGIDTKIEDLVLYCSARDGGFLDDPEVRRKVEQKRAEVLIDLYLKEMVVPKITFRHEEFRDYYESHQEEFRGPDDIQLLTILLPTQEEAEATLERLNRGADFAFLKQKAEAAAGDPIGDRGWIGLGTLPPPMAEQLKTISIGGIGGPFAVETGWLLVKMKDRRPGPLRTIEEADGEIRRVMFQQKFNEILDRQLEALKAASRIVRDEKAIDEYFGSGS
ncbi:MAG: peptidyl-prolyl cis-trans isomerase, partial [Candidatus Eisenbacteria bacterium]|nr:peptidyl-prolyl cis-trans isomerase [Candidatus Eisenbacteria bacterium]